MTRVLFLTAGVLALHPLSAQNLVGKPLPALELTHSLQGVPWTPEELRGHIVVLDLFQLDAPGCMALSMPESQKLHDRYRSDSRVKVVVVATAFEKDGAPRLADEKQIVARLRERHWTMPVMRDKDELSVRLLGVDGKMGVPMTLVSDRAGVVRWHAFSSPDAAPEVAATVERLLADFPVPRLTEFPKPLAARVRAYHQGKYAKVYSWAKTAEEKSSTPPETYAIAVQVAHDIEDGLKKLTEDGDRFRKLGHPAAAVERFTWAAKLFKGIPGADAASDRVRALKKDPELERELELERKLERLLGIIGRPAVDWATLTSRMEDFAEEAAGTPVAERLARYRQMSPK